jgi:ribosomal protein L6P/L9E
MRLPEISRTIQVPEDVTVSLQGKVVSVKGKQGNLTGDFSFAPISIDADGENVRISAK